MNESSGHFANRTLDEFTADLAAKKSVPGGGAAAGSMLAHAAGLAGMVIAFSHGKKKFAEFEPDLAEAAGRLERIREESLELADLDAHGFKTLADLWPLAEDDPVRASTGVARGGSWRDRRTAATRAPGRGDGRDHPERLVGRSSTLLRSDLAIAGRLAGFAAEAAGWNVDVNLECTPRTGRRRPAGDGDGNRDARQAIRAAIAGAAAIDDCLQSGRPRHHLALKWIGPKMDRYALLEPHPSSLGA